MGLYRQPIFTLGWGQSLQVGTSLCLDSTRWSNQSRTFSYVKIGYTGQIFDFITNTTIKIIYLPNTVWNWWTLSHNASSSNFNSWKSKYSWVVRKYCYRMEQILRRSDFRIFGILTVETSSGTTKIGREYRLQSCDVSRKCYKVFPQLGVHVVDNTITKPAYYTACESM